MAIDTDVPIELAEMYPDIVETQGRQTTIDGMLLQEDDIGSVSHSDTGNDMDNVYEQWGEWGVKDLDVDADEIADQLE